VTQKIEADFYFQDQDNVKEYREHASPVNVAKIAPNGQWVASAGSAKRM